MTEQFQAVTLRTENTYCQPFYSSFLFPKECAPKAILWQISAEQTLMKEMLDVLK